MKVAIVILNWNGKALLQEFLPKTIRYSNSEYCDIYLADNASTDDSIVFIEQNFSTVKIIKNDTNYGFAQGYNIALTKVEADIFALVNSDIEVTENWLEPILTTFKKEKNTAIIQPKILDYKDKSKFEYAGASGGYLDKYGYPFCRGRIFDSIEKDSKQYDTETSIFWASGACFFIRKEVFEALKGFDASFFAHQEEIDLCWRARNSNYDIKCIPKSVVYHVGGATLKEGNPKKTFLNFRNNLVMLSKNLPKNKLLIIIISRLFLDGIAGVKFLFQLKPLHTFAIIKAHFSFYSILGKALKFRKITSNKISNYYIVNNILWQYFVLKNKKFSKLIRNTLF